MIDRSGWGTGWMTPRSGHVPTTTFEPESTSVCTASPRREADAERPLRAVMSLPPMRMTDTSGLPPVICIASICDHRPLEDAPTIALVESRTDCPDSSARPFAMSTPGSSSREEAPSPAAVESPKTINSRSACIPRRQVCGAEAPGR